MDQRLFERVIALCALSPLLGPGTVRRALKDVGADPATATIDDYCRAVPRLEARLRCFLPVEEAIRRARSVLQLKAQLGGAPDEVIVRVGPAGEPTSGWVARGAPAGGAGGLQAEATLRDERKVTG